MCVCVCQYFCDIVNVIITVITIIKDGFLYFRTNVLVKCLKSILICKHIVLFVVKILLLKILIISNKRDMFSFGT